MKISRFLQWRRTRDRRTARWLPISVRLRTSQHTSAVFFSFLDECHRYRGIEERVYLSPELSVLLFPPTTHFRIALSHVRIHFSHEQNIGSPSMTLPGQLAPFFAIARPWDTETANLGTLKNHRKLTKIATTIIFSQR